ncbi:MAG: molybdopterin adenylyltransferase [Planctomycetes bacterium]|nr:molybdopterin adenylyltransferase [Planctomycetota bacterium]
MNTARLRIGIVTVSDRATRGEYEDKSGPAIRVHLARIVRTPFDEIARLVPDERDLIEAALRELCDVERCALVLTTGGTGPAPRDVTPEATASILEKPLPGMAERMRAISLPRVPGAMLSRQLAGTRGSTLVINLPGSPGAIADCLYAVFPAIPHCLELIGAPRLETHADILEAFRPNH